MTMTSDRAEALRKAGHRHILIDDQCIVCDKPSEDLPRNTKSHHLTSCAAHYDNGAMCQCGTTKDIPSETYITNQQELDELISRDRLTNVLVRYRGKSEGRFRAPAQDVPDLIKMLVETDHYVRDLCY